MELQTLPDARQALAARVERLVREKTSGLIRDKIAPLDQMESDWPSSIAAVGFALACYPVAVVRGFLTHEDALQRTLITLRFFAQPEHLTKISAGAGFPAVSRDFTRDRKSVV